jgi:hypothetical protein
MVSTFVRFILFTFLYFNSVSSQASRVGTAHQRKHQASPTNANTRITGNGGQCPPYKKCIIATGARCQFYSFVLEEEGHQSVQRVIQESV